MLAAVDLPIEPISGRPDVNNWGFIVFLLLFLVYSIILSSRIKLIYLMVRELIQNKGNNSIYYETVDNDMISRVLLCMQTVVIFSIITYCYGIEKMHLSIEFDVKALAFFGLSLLTAVVYIIYKLLIYNITGYIFFPRFKLKIWKSNFLSIISLMGLVIFIPVLVMFYAEKAFNFCFYLVIFFAILALFFSFYKLYSLFFREKGQLLHFILYLCAQELIPLYLMYKGIGVIYLIVQKDNLWIHT